MAKTKQFQCDAVILDNDGVLIDSTALIERHWQEWAEKHGLDLDQVTQVMHGRPTIETMQLVAPHLDVKTESARMESSEAADTVGLKKIDGAVELVGSLPKGSWAVATSGSLAIARTRLEYAGVPIPDVLVTIDDVARGKPDPEAYLLAAEQLGIAPEQCIVIEDAPAGIKAAHSAGMRVIAVATTHPNNELEDADVVVARISDVVFSNPAKLTDVPICLTVHHL